MASPVSSIPGRVARAVLALGFLWIAALTVYYTVFSLKLADDEGYLMISIRGFLEGNPLFDSVFTQYGPFYYFYEWILRAPLGIPLTHDATRFLCMFHLLAAAGVLGWAGARLTRSYLGGLLVFMQAVVHLLPVLNEPGHPQEIVALLLACAVLVVAAERPMVWTLTALALLGVALSFIKVNVGAFFGFAWLLALRCGSTDALARHPWNKILIAACAALPVLLMRRHLGEPWCVGYAAVMLASVVTTLSLADATAKRESVSPRSYLRLFLALAIPTAAMLALTRGLGTSWQGLVDGLITTPLKMPGVALLPLAVPPAAIVTAGAALALAIATLRNQDRWSAPLAWLKGLYGVIGAFALVRDPASQLAFLLPWVWLVLVPPPTRRGPVLSQSPTPAAAPATSPANAPASFAASGSFARVFLAIAAAWQGLQGYPIAGTQVALGTLLMVPIFALCLVDAVREMAASQEKVAAGKSALSPGSRALGYGLAAVVMLFIFANVWCQPQAKRLQYEGYTPLDLPGSSRVRLEPGIVAMYQPLMRYLSTECDTFVTYPGFNSFYFWTGKRPPTQCNSTGWGQLTIAQQENILGTLRGSSRPLLVVHEYAMRNWDAEGPAPIRPLVRCVRDHCREIQRIGPFVIYALR